MFFLPLILGGISAASQLGAANRRERLAESNRLVSDANSAAQLVAERNALRFDRIRIRAGYDSARTQFRLNELEIEARERNAQRLRLFAEARTEQSREAIRRRRRDQNAFSGTQRATVAASGVAFQGSVLDVLAETAGQMQVEIEDMQRAAEFERSETLTQAGDMERGAGLSRMANRLSLSSARRGFRLDMAANKMGQLSASRSHDSRLFGNAMQLAAQQDAATGQRWQAAGTLFAGINNTISNRYIQQREIDTQSGGAGSFNYTATI